LEVIWCECRLVPCDYRVSRELDRELWRRQQVFHHSLVDYVVGPFFVGRFDEEFAAELSRLEVDIVGSEEFCDFVEEAFAADEERFEGKGAVTMIAEKLCVRLFFPDPVV
jgi:hypothetical protein